MSKNRVFENFIDNFPYRDRMNCLIIMILKRDCAMKGGKKEINCVIEQSNISQK